MNTIARILDLIFAFIYMVLTVRFLLEFFQARRGTGFYELITSASTPFFAPFRDIVASGTFATHPVVWSLIVAMLGYGLLHGVFRALLRVLPGGR